MTRRGNKKKGNANSPDPSSGSDLASTEPPPARGGTGRYALRAQPAATDAYTPPVTAHVHDRHPPPVPATRRRTHPRRAASRVAVQN